MRMILKGSFFFIVFAFLFLGIQHNAHADYAHYTGTPYPVETGAPDVYRTCCPNNDCITPPNCSQQYDYDIYGINYNFTSGSAYWTAPCAGVIIANNVTLHVAKFAWRLSETSTIRCGAPSIRWEDLPNKGGLIHASVDIGKFDDAG